MGKAADDMRMRFDKWFYFVLCLILIAAVILAMQTNTASAEEQQIIPTEIVITHSPTINTDAVETIWNILREEYTETATAAIIGNLCYESGLYPYRIEGCSLYYSEKFNDGFIEKSKFWYTGNGYGLAMWTGGTNHQRMWKWCEENGYAVDSLEGQVRFLMADYPYMAEASSIRINHYEPEDIVAATEDFRQSYEKSHYSPSSQYGRARYAKSAYVNFGDETYADTVLDAPYNFEIYQKVNALNSELGLKRKHSW